MSCTLAQDRLEVLQIYRLLQWVHKGEKAEIEKMVKLGVKNLINLKEPRDGLGVLHLAVSTKNSDLVDLLLSLGAHPDVQDLRGRTPVMLAAEMGNEEIFALLLQKQPDMRLVDAEGKGVLFYCNYPTKRHARCLQVALKNQADPNNVSAEGVHVLNVMCEKADECTPLCLILLDAGADPDATNEGTGVTALMEAARTGSLPVVRDILRRGGNPNALDKKCFSAVHYAALSGSFEVIQVLSSFAAEMGVVNLDNCTPLHYAAATGNANSCKFLAQRGCNPKLKNKEGLLPRQIAKDSGHKAAAKELRKAEKQFGKGNKSNSGTLMSDPWALTLHDWSNEHEAELGEAFGDKLAAVSTETFLSVLEELNAPVELAQLHTVVSAHDMKGEGVVNVTDFIKGVKYIKKPFRLSVYVSQKKKKERGGKGGKKKKKGFVLPMPICTLVPELKPRRPDGGPPDFMIEKYHNLSDVRRFDHDHPPIHPIVNDSGWYIEKPNKIYINVNYCVRNGDLESLDLAFSQGVPVDAQDEYYKSPLMEACSSGNYEMAQYLLSKGADVSLCDQFFWTPLHHAAHGGHLEIVELLVNAGAEVNVTALSEGTPLMRAIESSSFSCVDFLIKAGARVNAESKKGQNCLEIARNFGDPNIVQLLEDMMSSLPEAKAAKESGGKQKPAKKKVATTQGAVQSRTMTGTSSARTPTQTNSQSVVLHNSRITAGKANTVDVSFVPKTVWGKPPTTSQLMANIERRKERLTLEVDFDDLLMPFSQRFQARIMEITKPRTKLEESQRQRQVS
ncbi:ankyrin repeat and EF-hand domain-containing protein 1 [Fundulus heteroclitus]|uniref:ankyrin repeat and EF-hand domain-containing protein 1 n=1 Tax=Fundulus heteroclitus TaxID=8078 RepID=UPI00165B0AB0|nr:ankyrin repeat and EF-hand domain-containing protein 1 [Fundulus heteroclitus]XP_021180023.2 ankyrin repeat and EF-hand domain-containing protein 1 [Fundulus heteroclitus]